MLTPVGHTRLLHAMLQDALAAYKKSRPTSAIAEELTYNPVAATARELIPASTEDVLKEVADRLPLTTTYCTRMADVIEHMVNRHIGAQGAGRMAEAAR